MSFSGVIERLTLGIVSGWALYTSGGQTHVPSVTLKFRNLGTFSPTDRPERESGITGFVFELPKELADLNWSEFIEEFEGVDAEFVDESGRQHWSVPLYKSVLTFAPNENPNARVDIARVPPASKATGMNKTVAVISDAVSTDGFFDVWHRYYGDLFGPQNLYFLTYAGSMADFSGYGLGGVWRIPQTYNDNTRKDVVNSLVSALLSSYDWVVRADIDEFLVPDVRKYPGLREYINALDQPYVTARGVELFEDSTERELSYSEPILVDQRKYGVRASALNKTCITSVPISWGPGFHEQTVFPVFSDLYLFHTKFADISAKSELQRTMLLNSPDNVQLREYCSDDAQQKLTAAREWLSAKNKIPGWEGLEASAFDQEYLSSVRMRTIGYYLGNLLINSEALIVPEQFAGIF